MNDFVDVEFFRPNISEPVVKPSDTVGRVSDNLIPFSLQEVDNGIISRLGSGRSTYYVLGKS